MELKSLGTELLEFFEELNEYDVRIYLRDCIDIVHFKKNEMKQYYPNLVFSFLAVARMANEEYIKGDDFYNYINECSCKNGKDLFEWICRTIYLGMKKVNEIENELIVRKWLKTQNEEITA